MPVEPSNKFKSENYQEFGGINSKYSVYNLSPMEFLDLKNMDFQTVGALTQRWGSTQYIGQTFSGQINGLFEFARLDGSSWIVLGSTGAGMWYGATQGNLQGISFSTIGATRTIGMMLGYDAGSNLFNSAPPPFLYNGTTFAFGPTIFVSPLELNANRLSFVTFDNFLFAADGDKFVKFDGTTLYSVGLPYVNFATTGCTLFGTSQGFGDNLIVHLGQGTTNAGYLFYYLTYVNNRGFEGPLTPLITSSQGITVGGGDIGAYIYLAPHISTPLDLGISSINVYVYFGVSLSQAALASADQFTPFLYQSFPASGSTITTYAIGSSNVSIDPGANSGNLWAGVQPYQIGSTFVISTTPYYNHGAITSYQLTPFYPRYLEVYQNRLFLAGFSTALSEVWFSDVGEPEMYQPDWNFEVRTNDGDYITALKTYRSQLYIFKRHSFHVLYGDNPNNFDIVEISTQFGCLNNRCVAAFTGAGGLFNETLLFLDQKGVLAYNGTWLNILSTKVQSYFDRMNYSAALNCALMAHDKIRNQILIAIPIDGSSTNNITLVYDYLAQAWTTYDGFTPSVFVEIMGANSTKNIFYGDTSGRVNWFGPSFLSDNGIGFTSHVKSRFLHDQGDSSTKSFRRLYLNIDQPASGGTFSIPVNFYQDYGSSQVLSTTLVISQFQNRLEYGIEAKSLAFEMYSIETSQVFRLYGFTIESRTLRNV